MAEILVVGMDNSQNKTPPTNSRGRNEMSYGNRSRVVGVPVIVEPVVVPVPPVVVPVEVTDVEVAIGVAVM